MKKTIFTLLCGLLSVTAGADTQSVVLTTNKASGTPLTILLNNSRTGVSVDWGNGTPVAYTQATDGIIEAKGNVAGATVTITSERPITMLAAADCGLTAIDLTGAPSLTSLYLQNNALTTIDLSKGKALRDLNLSNNQLTAVTLSTTNNPELETLDVSHNAFTSTSFTYGSDKLRYLGVSGNGIKTLSLTKDTGLLGLKANDNSITSLNITSATNLTMLDVSNNSIARLNVPEALTTLQQVYVDNNKISGSIDLSACKQLNVLDVSHNEIDGVALPASTKLQAYDCCYNNMTFSSLPRTNYQPTLYFNYQPQGVYDISVLDGINKGSWGSDYLPWATMSPGYDKRQDAAYVVDMTGLRSGSGNSSVKFAFYEIAEDGTETALQQASAASKTLDYANINGKVTFQRPMKRVYAVMTDDGYPELVIRTSTFAVLDTAAEGISEVETATEQSTPVYDIQGRRVESAARGLYIMNNKKVILK